MKFVGDGARCRHRLREFCSDRATAPRRPSKCSRGDEGTWTNRLRSALVQKATDKGTLEGRGGCAFRTHKGGKAKSLERPRNERVEVISPFPAVESSLKGALPGRTWGRSSAGRASQWHCEGQGFDPPRLHHPPPDRQFSGKCAIHTQPSETWACPSLARLLWAAGERIALMSFPVELHLIEKK